jgi:hypothetical protein
MSPMSRVGMKSKTPERKRPEANTKVMLLWNFGKPGGFFRVREHMSVEIDMRRPIAALVLTAGLAMATVAPPNQAQAQGRDWGWGVVAGFVAGAAIANSTPGYPGYYGYGYPAYGYAYPRYGLGYGYGYGLAYGVSYAYPPYYGGYDRPYYGYAYAGPRAVRRVVVHRARWR